MGAKRQKRNGVRTESPTRFSIPNPKGGLQAIRACAKPKRKSLGRDVPSRLEIRDARRLMCQGVARGPKDYPSEEGWGPHRTQDNAHEWMKCPRVDNKLELHLNKPAKDWAALGVKLLMRFWRCPLPAQVIITRWGVRQHSYLFQWIIKRDWAEKHIRTWAKKISFFT